MIIKEDDFEMDDVDFDDFFEYEDEPEDAPPSEEHIPESVTELTGELKDEEVSEEETKSEPVPVKQKTEPEQKKSRSISTPLEQFAEARGEKRNVPVSELNTGEIFGQSSENIAIETEGKLQLLTGRKTEVTVIKCSKEQADVLIADHMLRTQTLTVGKKAKFVSVVNTPVGKKLFKVDSIEQLYGISEKDVKKLELVQNELPEELLSVDMDFDTIIAVSKLNKTQCGMLADTVQDLEIKKITKSSVNSLAEISRPTERDVIRILREEIKKPDDALIRQIVEDTINNMKQKGNPYDYD